MPVHVVVDVYTTVQTVGVVLMSDGWHRLTVEVPGKTDMTPVELETREPTAVPQMSDAGVDVATPKSKLVVVPFAKDLVTPV